MKVTTTSLDTLKDPNPTLVFQKIPKKTSFALPAEQPLYECELVKKGKLTKNKRYFMFYPTKCLFFQVNFTFPFIFPIFFAIFRTNRRNYWRECAFMISTWDWNGCTIPQRRRCSISCTVWSSCAAPTAASCNARTKITSRNWAISSIESWIFSTSTPITRPSKKLAKATSQV